MSEEKSDVFDEDNESFDLYPDENQDLTEEEKAKKKHVFSDQDQRSRSGNSNIRRSL